MVVARQAGVSQIRREMSHHTRFFTAVKFTYMTPRSITVESLCHEDSNFDGRLKNQESGDEII